MSKKHSPSYAMLKTQNEELQIVYERTKNDYEYFKKQMQDLIEKNKLLQETLAQKDYIIKIQSVNNRVLLEKIMKFEDETRNQNKNNASKQNSKN